MYYDENAGATPQSTPTPTPTPAPARPTKFCSHCGKVIDAEAVICPMCGCQVKEFVTSPNVVINNTNSNINRNVAPVYAPRPRDKWVALILCFFLGVFGIHKFYEGKAGMGVLYLFTCGLAGFGPLVDFIVLLFKPNPYYV